MWDFAIAEKGDVKRNWKEETEYRGKDKIMQLAFKKTKGEIASILSCQRRSVCMKQKPPFFPELFMGKCMCQCVKTLSLLLFNENVALAALY